MNQQSTEFTPADIPSGRKEIDGIEYIQDAKGGWVPVSVVKPQRLLRDEFVRKEMGYAVALSEQIARFMGHVTTNLGQFEALLAQEYNTEIGGSKGNVSLTSHCGCFQIKVQVQDHFAFGPEMHEAKKLFDACMNEWAAGAPEEMRALVTRAFNTDKEGKINRSDVFMLLNLETSDERWKEGQRALRDAMEVIGSKEYVRFYRRDNPKAKWQAVTIDLAKV